MFGRMCWFSAVPAYFCAPLINNVRMNRYETAYSGSVLSAEQVAETVSKFRIVTDKAARSSTRMGIAEVGVPHPEKSTGYITIDLKLTPP